MGAGERLNLLPAAAGSLLAPRCCGFWLAPGTGESKEKSPFKRREQEEGGREKVGMSTVNPALFYL